MSTVLFTVSGAEKKAEINSLDKGTVYNVLYYYQHINCLGVSRQTNLAVVVVPEDEPVLAHCLIEMSVLLSLLCVLIII